MMLMDLMGAFKKAGFKKTAALLICAVLIAPPSACGKDSGKNADSPNAAQTGNADTSKAPQNDEGDTVSTIALEDNGDEDNDSEADDRDTVTTTAAASTAEKKTTTAAKETTAVAVQKTTTTTAATAPAVQNEPKDTDFVRVREYIPDTAVELMYATDRNFTGEVIYDFSDAWLRYGTVKKLQKAQEMLKKQGYRIKIWDAFRPVSAQFKLWEICPDPKYVSNPNKGFSSHSRGNTVDITLVDSNGDELAMPTGFDNFTALADRDYSDVTDETALANVRLLEKTMKACGFKPYAGEWWHFSDSDAYEVAKQFEPKA